MKAACFVLALALAEAPSRLSLFTYSRDSLHGFKDEALEVFRRELGKHAESFAEVAYSTQEARVRVQLLGPGELQVEIGDEEESSRYLFRSDPAAPKTWALVRIGKFAKEFSVEGRGQRDLSRLAKNVADWLRENEANVR